MSLNAMGLGLVFTVRDLASGQLARIERQFMSLDERVSGGRDRLERAFKGVGAGLALLTAGAVPLGGAFALADVAGKFQQAIASVGAVSGASARELEGLREAALQAGIATQYSPTEATVGLDQLAQAGFNAKQSVGLLIPVLDLAAGSLGRLNPESAAGLVAQTMKSFGLETADEAKTAVDKLVQSANMFALNAGDLPLAMGHVAGAAQTMNQSLDQSLIAFGLIKNLIPGLERSSTAAAVAMERMADPRMQQMLGGLGVQVADSAGKFRPFLDIVAELGPKLDTMSEKARAGFLLKAFGREALGGVGAILTQLGNGIRNDAGALLQGADAVAFLQGQFKGAAGTARNFAKALLDTYEGQKRLLRGSVETLQIILGETFADAFRPAVSAIVSGLNAIIERVKAMPAPVKRAIAGLIVAASTLVALVGGALAAKASLALLVVGLKVVGVTFGGIAATLGAGLAILGALALAFVGMRVAFDKNVGGIADRLRGMGAAVSLAFRALGDIVEHGGLSEAVARELFRVENQGVRRFVTQVGMFAFRLQRLWRGIAIGLEQAIVAGGPAFEALSEAFRSISEQFEELVATVLGGGTELRSDKFLFFGHSVGEAFGMIVRAGARVLTVLLELGSGALSGIRTSFKWLGGALGFVGKALADFGATWTELWGGGASKGTEQAAFGFRDLGRVLAKVAGGILTGIVYAFGLLVYAMRESLPTLRGMWTVVSGLGVALTFFGELAWTVLTEVVPDAIQEVGTAFADLFQGASTWWEDFDEGLHTFVDNIVDGAESAVDAVGEFFSALVRRISGAFDSIARGARALVGMLPDALLPGGLAALRLTSAGATGVTPIAPASAAIPSSIAAAGAAPAAVDARGRAEAGLGLAAVLAARPAGQGGATPPFVVELKVDGETLARASHKASADVATRSLAPLPTY